jgi:hypothetical protein
MKQKSKRIVGTLAAFAVIVSIVMVSVPAKEEEERTERQFKEVYEIYKEQFGEIPEEQLEKISKQEFIKAYEIGFWGHDSSKEGVGTRSCPLGDVGAELSWYKPPYSWKIYHWARAAADAYQLCEHISVGGDVNGATAFVYENTETNTGFAAAEGDEWGHFHWYWKWTAWNDAWGHFVVDETTNAWDYEYVDGPGSGPGP